MRNIYWYQWVSWLFGENFQNPGQPSLLSKAIEEAKSLQFESAPKFNLTLPISDEELKTAEIVINKKIYPVLAKKMPFYWGNSCQLLSSHIFGFLNAVGIRAEIIIGEVRVQGSWHIGVWYWSQSTARRLQKARYVKGPDVACLGIHWGRHDYWCWFISPHGEVLWTSRKVSRANTDWSCQWPI